MLRRFLQRGLGQKNCYARCITGKKEGKSHHRNTGKNEGKSHHRNTISSIDARHDLHQTPHHVNVVHFESLIFEMESGDEEVVGGHW